MELRDTFGRKIDYIRLSVTDRCNLRCIYCAPGGANWCSVNPRKLIGFEKMLSFLGVARKYGLKKVRITGGEPLLRKDIVRIVSSIKELGIEDLGLTTNGQLLPIFAQKLKRAGLDRVNISLDSLSPERYWEITGGGSLSRALLAVSVAERVFWPAPVKINMVPIRGINEDEIADFAAMTLENPFHVRFIELMPVGGGKKTKTFEGLRITAGEAKKTISSQLLPLGRTGSSDNYKVAPDAKGVIGFISPMSGHFCDSCNRLRITADGKIRPCLFSDYEEDLNTATSDAGMERLLLASVLGKAKGSLLEKGVKFEAMQQIGG